MNEIELDKERELLDMGTGEKFTASLRFRRTDRTGFEIAYLSLFYEIFDTIGNTKMKVLRCLLESRDSNNLIIGSSRDIAKKSGYSHATVFRTLRELIRIGVLHEIRSCVYVFDPRCVVKGGKGKERYILTKYEITDAGKKSKQSASGYDETKKAYTPETPAKTPDPFPPYVTGIVANE